ncbi:DUF2335 domain-containing protein [Flagellimonas crocea]|uniref:DUF2335 domain-containing protein n=1 Tax=Flagellimonas crocea TaxID=3067311 RepID=UPI00296F5893|nr:DUF2335 domain-containing protein [Muricauda sp. DH64]
MAKNKSNNSEQLTKQVLQAYPELKSPSKARNLVRMVSQQISIKSGPYPSPEDYEHYHDIDPSLTDLMKQMVVDEQKHQHRMDERFMDKDFKLRKSGQWFAFFVFLAVVALGAYSVHMGFEWGGAIITAFGVTGIVTQFLRRR